jgi:hypothetical protein
MSNAIQIDAKWNLELEWNCTSGYILYSIDEIPDDVMINNGYTYVDAHSQKEWD